MMGTPSFDGPEPQDPDLLPSSEEASGDLAERRDLPDSEDGAGGAGGGNLDDPLEKGTFDVTG